MAPCPRGRVHLHLEREGRKTWTHKVALFDRFTRHDAAADQQSENPKHGRLRQSAQLRELVEAHGLLGFGN